MARVVTLGEVARAAGVSLATASRALNGSTRRVNAELAERVVAAAQELGYVANSHAQAVARGSTDVLGLIVHDIADPYFAAIASGVTSAADRHGLMVLLCCTNRDPDRELAFVRMLQAQRARALVLAGARTTDRRHTEAMARQLSAFAGSGGRVAAITQPRLPVDTVAPENRAGAKALAVALATMGHRAFAVLAGPRSNVTAADRVAGFRAGLRSARLDLPDEAVVTGAFTRDGGYEAATALLLRDVAFTCLFAVTDVMALGAMAALREAGVAVPDSLSVAGFDDIATLRDLTPPLTTVRLPLESMGEQACELALASPGGSDPTVVRVSGEVVVRGSTTPPRDTTSTTRRRRQDVPA